MPATAPVRRAVLDAYGLIRLLYLAEGDPVRQHEIQQAGANLKQAVELLPYEPDSLAGKAVKIHAKRGLERLCKLTWAPDVALLIATAEERVRVAR